MNPLQCAIIEKAGNDHGFEHVLSSSVEGVNLASARHPTRASIIVIDAAYSVRFQSSFSIAALTLLWAEIQRWFCHEITGGTLSIRRDFRVKRCLT